MSEVSVLNSAEAIPTFTSPQGVKYSTFQVEGHPLLWEVYAVRADEFDREIADHRARQPVAGMFTGRPAAEVALTQWLRLQWKASDEVAAKLDKRNPNKAKQAESVAA